MSLRTPSRRLAQPAAVLKCLAHPPTTSAPIHSLQAFIPHRTLFGRLFGRKKDTAEPSTSGLAASPTTDARNPILEEYMKKKPSNQRPQLVRGDLSSSSIFESDRRQQAAEKKEEAKEGKVERDPSVMAAALDPDPRARRRWERKMVMRDIRRGGRLSKTAVIKRTERESLSKSPMLKTSTKKLGMLARQIAGKPLEAAIVQMRFSKKKVAQEVRKHLEYARDEAIVKRGMGLGEAEGTKGEPVEIETKEGKRMVVKDRTGIYVDQAWVGRGPFGVGYDYRARGKLNFLRPPHTTISVILKEEATRIRLSEEKQKKRANRKLWVQLPDRPVTTQRQYYSW